METKLEKEVRFLKIYAVVATLFCAIFLLTAFTLKSGDQKFEEITTNRIKFVDSAGKEQSRIGAQSGKGSKAGLIFYDSAGKARLRIGADIGNGSFAGLVFYNEDQTEAGVFMYNGKRDKDGKIEAASLLTMDQFKSDEVIRLVYDHEGDQKRQGLLINDRPDTMSPEAEKVISDLARALQSAKSEAERQALRREYLSKLPAREIVARRLFAGRDVDGASLVTLSDPDGKPRLQLKVDTLGKASITFLDSSGRVVRTVKP
jgi:hypothetical protein